MPKLILKFESAVIKELPMTANTLTIGRKPDNDLVIDHPAVSGHHCKIVLQGDTYFVEDLNSTNGTLVNDKKIIKSGIHHQDVVAIAKHTLVFVDDRPISAESIARMQQPEVQAVPQIPPAAKSAAAPVAPPAPATSNPMKGLEKIGSVHIMEGAVGQEQFELMENSTYIGKSDRAAIKIKGMLAPDVAAMINRKANGYFLVAVKEGYPKVNGIAVEKERQLNEGDTIEVGGTKMQFYLKSLT